MRPEHRFQKDYFDMLIRLHALQQLLESTIPFVGEHVIGTLLADEHALARLSSPASTIPPRSEGGDLNDLLPTSPRLSSSAFLQHIFDQVPPQDRQAHLLEGVEQHDPALLALLDAYVCAALSMQDQEWEQQMEILTYYPFHGGLVPWAGVRAALRECNRIQDEREQEALLERAIALYLWCLSDAIVDQAVDQHGWYYLSSDSDQLPQDMLHYTPDWLRGDDPQEVLLTELRAFPLSERLLHFLDDLADAGQNPFGNAFCAAWEAVRAAQRSVAPLQERTFVYAEVFALEDSHMAEQFNAWCIHNDLPPYFAERLDRTLLTQVHTTGYLVDLLDLPVLSEVVGPYLEDWLLENATVQEAVRVRVPSGEHPALLAEKIRVTGFAAFAYTDKVLVQIPASKLEALVREGTGV